jgi:hypothetical protein
VRAAGLDLGESGRQHDGAPASELGSRAYGIGDTGCGDGNDQRVDRLGQIGDGRNARPAENLVALGVHPPDRPLEASSLEVPQHVAAVGVDAIGRADDSDGARR